MSCYHLDYSCFKQFVTEVEKENKKGKGELVLFWKFRPKFDLDQHKKIGSQLEPKESWAQQV